MKRIRSLCHRPTNVLLLCAALLIPAASAFAADDPPKLKPGTYLPVSAIKPGMKGIGKTAFQGTKVSTFDIEVLGVVPDAMNGRPLIIVKMEGGPITERGSGIASGMSGSPVYIDGKIIGATAIGYGWTNDKIAGVTPIEAMFEAFDPALPDEPTDLAAATTFDFESPVRLAGIDYERLAFSSEPPTEDGSRVLHMRPWRPQLVVSEGLAEFLPEIRTHFPNAEFAFAGAYDPGLMGSAPHAKIEPGSPLGAFYLWGDFLMGGIGTATWIEDEWFLAFGHPMGGVGPISAPATSAYVTDFYPSLAMSNKISYPIEIVGTTTQDAPWSVGGRLGEEPDMIPMEIVVVDKELDRKRTFHLFAVKHPQYTAMLLRLSLAASVGLVRTIEADTTATVSFELETENFGTISRENVFFSPTNAAPASNDLADVISILTRNPFGPAEITGLKAKIEIEGGHSSAIIEAISVSETEFEPGDTVDIEVSLRPYRADLVKKTLSLKIPDDAPETEATVTVRGGTVKETPVVNGKPIRPRGPAAEAERLGYGTTRLEQIVSRYLEQPKNNEIIASLSLGRSFPVISGRTLGSLPRAFAPAFKARQIAGGILAEERIYSRAPSEWVVQGTQSLKIKVKAPREEAASGRREPESEEPTADETEEARGGAGSATFTSWGLSLPETMQEDEPAATAPKGEVKEADKPIEERGGTAPPEEDAEAEKPEAEETAKPLIRQPKQWVQAKKDDFEKGELSGLSCDSEGKLRVVHSFSKVCDIAAKAIWCAVPDGSGGAYVGTGHEGKVYRISPQGGVETVLETGDVEVFSLCRADDGTLFAGTGPDGKVYKIAPDGESAIAADLEEEYVLGLAAGAKGEVYAGVGPQAKVYRIDPDGSSSVVFTPEQAQHVMSLAWAPDGTLYVGTGDEGMVYSRSADGATRAVFDPKQAYVTALDVDPDGNLYVGCSPEGTVTKIKPDGPFDGAQGKEAVTLLEAEEGVTALIAEQGIAGVATLGGAFMADEETNAPLDTEENLQITGLCAGESGALYLATSNPAALWQATFPQTGTIESSVFDSGEGSRWSTVSWIGKAPEGATLAIKTRSGNTSEPDETWSRWSSPYGDSQGKAVASPQGRFIQYRAELSGSAELSSVAIAYLPRNSEPEVEIEEPSARTAWSGKETIEWKGKDPDGDKIEYNVFYSHDGGATWLSLGAEVKREGLEPPEPEPAEAGEEAAEPEGAASPFDLTAEEVEARIRHDIPQMFPDIPDEDLDQMVADALREFEKAKREYKKLAEEGEAPTGPRPPASEAGPKEKSSAEWDTTEVEDGVYIIKVVATDKPSNPEGWLSDEAISEPVTVCNTPPDIWLPRAGLTVEEGRARLRGTVSQKVVAITGVEWRVGEGDWRAAAPADGIFDTRFERFEIATDPLEPGDHKIEIRAFNSAGLKASIERPVTVTPE